MKRALALDFDGLLCDALTESVLTTWNGYHGKSLNDFNDDGLAAIPPQFIEHFTLCRSFAKHLGHFRTSLLSPFPVIQNQQDFEAAYQAIPADDIRRFIDNVSQYRTLAREERTQTWLGYHRLYPGIVAFLNDLPFPTYIVTAKDAASVGAILQQAGVAFAPSHIFGDQQAKIGALQAIQQHEGVEPESLFFFDDNLPNVLEARRAGYTAFWALWGYNAPDHFALAQIHQIPSIDLPVFLTNNPALS